MASIAVVDGLDISSLRLFLAVVELGSVSKAAKRLRLAQPSATAKLHKLERQLGTQLLERTPTGSIPTEAGERLAGACSDAIDAATDLVDRAEALRSERDVVTIATTRHVADHFLTRWVGSGAAGRAEIRLLELDTLHAAQAVRSGEAELGLTEGPLTPLGLRSQIVTEEPIVAVVGRTHSWYGRKRSVAAADLVATTLVLGHRGSGTRDLVESSFAGHEWAQVGDRVDVPNATAARIAALNGTGVAFLPECWTRGEIRSGALWALKLDDVDIVQPVRVVWRGTEPNTPTARHFVAAITV